MKRTLAVVFFIAAGSFGKPALADIHNFDHVPDAQAYCAKNASTAIVVRSDLDFQHYYVYKYYPATHAGAYPPGRPPFFYIRATNANFNKPAFRGNYLCLSEVTAEGWLDRDSPPYASLVTDGPVPTPMPSASPTPASRPTPTAAPTKAAVVMPTGPHVDLVHDYTGGKGGIVLLAGSNGTGYHEAWVFAPGQIAVAPNAATKTTAITVGGTSTFVLNGLISAAGLTFNAPVATLVSASSNAQIVAGGQGSVAGSGPGVLLGTGGAAFAPTSLVGQTGASLTALVAGFVAQSGGNPMSLFGGR